MNVSILQFDHTNIFYVKKYLKKFNKWKDVNKNIFKYLQVGIVIGIIDNDKKECVGTIIAMNTDDGNGTEACYIVCYQIEQMQVGKISQQTLFSILIKYIENREIVINIPGNRNIVERNRNLVFGYSNNYYVKKHEILKNPFYRGVYSSVNEKLISHTEPELVDFCQKYAKINDYHIHPTKSIIDFVRENSDIHIETEYNLIYLKHSGSFNEIIAFWSLAHKNNSSSLNRKIFSDVKRELLKYNKPYIYDASVIRGAVADYNDGLLKISNVIRERNSRK